ncbi:MAG TPA: dTMP kinase [Candidatus Saccharimonadales bacterium]|nr:dTMP kinase [Candidatus Saccharimonadales bacterium]
MENRPGIFIALEGTDGSGKSTQFKLIAERLKKNGFEVETFQFPQYDNPSSYFIKEYLSGNLGSAESIGPYTASMFFAMDRFHTADKIRKALEKGKVVLADRFTGSNMAHQGTLFNNAEQRRGFFIWLDQIEFEMFKIPRPDISLVLRVPAEIAIKNVDKRGNKKDIHEKDMGHLKKSVEIYDSLCQLFPKDFKQIDCTRSGGILPPETINDQIWKTMMPYLPSKKLKKKIKNSGGDSPYLEKNDGIVTITDEGYSYLEPLITNTKDNVYAFTDKLSHQTIAAAMARLSRRGDDMRVTILDEFSDKDDEDEQLLKRVITAYGDDSVQQLAGQHVVIENASNILTKKLEWGRLAAYLEQSTRYIYFDKKDENGNYRYHKLPYLKKDVRLAYEETMDKIFAIYSYMLAKLTDHVRANSSVPKEERDNAWKSATRAQACDSARAVLPVATTSTVGIFASGQALESLIMHLLSDELAESHEVGRKLLIEARKVLPAFLERVDINERGVLNMGYKAFTRENTREIADELLSNKISGDNGDPVKLSDVWPRNEMEIIPDILYEHSSLSLDEIRNEAQKWPLSKKKKIIQSYIGDRYNRRHKPGRAFEKVHYSWDILCDYGIFRDLQRHRMVDDLNWQILTPRYGYEIPELVVEAGLSDEFEKCFDLSLKLYSLLQENGYEKEAQYATLLGHRMRWKMTFNAREAYHLIELRTSPQGHPSYRKIALQMYELINEVHPLIAGGMKFVNKGEDPELTRLAAERYTQEKLARLNK